MIRPWQVVVIAVAAVPMTVSALVYEACDNVVKWTLEQTK